MVPGFLHVQSLDICCAVWTQQLLLPSSLLAMLLAGKVLLLALHSLSHSMVEVVVARLDHLGYQLDEQGLIQRIFFTSYRTMDIYRLD